MSNSPALPPSADGPPSRFRAGGELFAISVLVLFLEMACIRWFPAHVLFLTFFTNIVLLASFLGISLGCLVADHPRNYLNATPALLALPVLGALAAEVLVNYLGNLVEVDNPASSQIAFFGTEYLRRPDLARFAIPIEAIGGFFFVTIALAFVGPGQLLGRAFNRYPHRIEAYTLNIVGSIAGVLGFAACSWLELSPLWWFLPIVLLLGYFLVKRPWSNDYLVRLALLLVVLVAASIHSGTWVRGTEVREYHWSPYYRIDYDPPRRAVIVNQIGHQGMIARAEPISAYAFPHLLNRDSGGAPFENVLIIGAGSGNDVSRALQWGAKHIDAVEIDPVIQRIGARDHPDRPYQDPRVKVHLDDGRNFLRSADRQYDLIVYALVDSLVLHSSFSNIRLESYLFTHQALVDVRRLLKPGGTFVMCNFFRHGWLVSRLRASLNEVFGAEPLTFAVPVRTHIAPDDILTGEFTFFFAGGTERLRSAFQQFESYWLSTSQAPTPETPNGFRNPPPAERRLIVQQHAEGQSVDWALFVPAEVATPTKALPAATDDWPFLYLRQRIIPNLTWRSCAVMGGLAIVLLIVFRPKGDQAGLRRLFNGRMFFLGAAFMLVETKAVVQFALLFGSTWMVNTLVFIAVLVTILLANVLVLALRPQRLWPFYVGLLVTLAVNGLVPIDFFLGMNRPLQMICASVLVFAPILFAGVIFGVSFARSSAPGRDYCSNIAGAMLGGLAENLSMFLGFQYLILVAAAFYLLSALFRTRAACVRSA